jgi:formate acetyltransferase 1
MSLGRVSTFLDVYCDRDLQNGVFTESEIQEFIDHFIMKLRMVRFLRPPQYNELFSGDPTWVTESIGGMGTDGRPLVTKNSFRFLQTLYNFGPAPEPNLTVLWSERLPLGFKQFLRPSFHRHQLHPVRKRRPDARLLRRRLRHRLLRLRNAHWQTDAVFWRAGEPGQGAALRHQRRQG